MKQNYIRMALTICLVWSFNMVSSQNQIEISEIKKEYDLAELQKLKGTLKAQQEAQRKKVLRLAQLKGWPITYTDQQGVFYGLVDVTDDQKPIYYKTDNVAAARSTRADWLHDSGGLGLNIEGQGMTAYVWDGGVARTSHQEYDGIGGENRFTNADGGSRNFHAAHVMGTIISSGFVASAKGMAPQASGRGYDWNFDLTEATEASMNGMLLSNHSYGFGAEDLNDATFGQYIGLSRAWDEIMYNAPYYLQVVSAGNDGNDNDSNGNPLDGNPFFDKLSGMKTAKNNIIVANGQDASIDSEGNLINVVRNSSSSEGPTDDYRIKPDIMGNGTGVFSTFEDADDDYSTISGTSMAAPNVTGSLLLLQQYYNQVNGSFMKASTLKGLALHTADDVGITGPDSFHGWGLMNTKRAAETIANNGLQSWVSEEILEQGETYSITVQSDGINPLMASICWTDLPGQTQSGANNTTPVLVNDLDIRISQNSDTFEPWRLTGVQTNSKGDNIVDPYERVDVNGASGEYTITVTHKGTLADGPQAFAIIITGVDSNFTFNTAESSQTVCSDVPAEFTFNYQQIGSTTTNFSVENLPSGATASFSSSSLDANGSTTLTIDNLDNVAAGSYQLTVVGDDGTETERRFINLRVYHPNFDNDPMVVSFPSNGATGLTFGQIYLQWDENLNAESYEIEVSDNPSFSTIIGSGAETDTDFSVSGLQDNTVYYWRIKPSNSCVVGEFSQIFSFQTGIEECNDTYDATDFSAATIFDSANNTAFVPININDDLTINRLIVKADITHRSVEDITVFLQEPSQLGSDTIILLDSECDDSDDLFDVTFDDNGTAVVCSPDSPAITGTIAPVQSLGSMSGQSSSGRWLFAVTDNILFDGGSIDAASITVCTTLSNTNLPTFLNNTIDVAANGSYTIQTSDLEASTTSETSDQQIFTVVTLPEKGTIVKNGLALTVGDTFTQQDIDNGLVDYTNTQTSIFDDSFIVDITNAANGWLPNQIIQFSANVVGVDTFQLSNFSVFPNPTEGIVSIRFETQNSDDVYIQLYDLQGRMILKQNYPSDQLRFEESIVFGNVANGIYLLRVSQGNRSVTKNIIISK